MLLAAGVCLGVVGGCVLLVVVFLLVGFGLLVCWFLVGDLLLFGWLVSGCGCDCWWFSVC